MSFTTEEIFSKTVVIQAAPEAVWNTLTQPVHMQQWMSETPIEIHTNWQEGSSILITGMHYKMKFENWGTVLQYQPYTVLEYTHLSSISRLPNEPHNHSILRFSLAAKGDMTELALTIRQFPTEAIYKHLAFYWMVTLEKIRKQVMGVSM